MKPSKSLKSLPVAAEHIPELQESLRFESGFVQALKASQDMHFAAMAEVQKALQVDSSVAETLRASQEAFRVEEVQFMALRDMQKVLEADNVIAEAVRASEQAFRMDDTHFAAMAEVQKALQVDSNVAETLRASHEAFRLDEAQFTALLDVQKALKADDVIAEAIRASQQSFHIDDTHFAAMAEVQKALQVDSGVAEVLRASQEAFRADEAQFIALRDVQKALESDHGIAEAVRVSQQAFRMDDTYFTALAEVQKVLKVDSGVVGALRTSQEAFRIDETQFTALRDMQKALQADSGITHALRVSKDAFQVGEACLSALREIQKAVHIESISGGKSHRAHGARSDIASMNELASATAAIAEELLLIKARAHADIAGLGETRNTDGLKLAANDNPAAVALRLSHLIRKIIEYLDRAAESLEAHASLRVFLYLLVPTLLTLVSTAYSHLDNESSTLVLENKIDANRRLGGAENKGMQEELRRLGGLERLSNVSIPRSERTESRVIYFVIRLVPLCETRRYRCTPIAFLRPGDEVELQEATGKWIKVRTLYESHNKHSGWVLKKYLKRRKASYP